MTGGVLALAAAPAEAARVDFKPHPHPHSHSTPAPAAPKKGHGHGHGHAAPGKPAKHGSAKRTSPKGGAFKPHAATRAATGPAVHSQSGWSGGAVSAPKPAAPKPAATTAPAPAPSHSSAWHRADSDHADRGVVRAFASDLKSAGTSAGFPMLLVAVMAAFLVVQHRLDKRDVKLSHADWVSDQGLEFSAPATIQH